MQTITTEEYSIEYPNKVVYAFTPALVRVTSLVGHLKARIEVAGADVGSYYETRDLRNGSATFDISRFLQLLYIDNAADFRNISYVDVENSSASPTVLEAQVSVSFSGGVADVFAEDMMFDVVWGVMTSSERSTPPERLRWFVNFPQTIHLALRDSSALVWGDYVYEPLADPKETGGSQYFRKEWVLPAVPSWMGYIQESSNPIRFGIYDTEVVSGDYITKGNFTCIVTPDFSQCGVYLRWIDELGRYQYFLFRETGYTTTSKEVEKWESGEMVNPLTFDNTVNVPTTKRQLLSRQHSRTLTAQGVNEDEVKLLRTLIASPVVEEYAGEDENGIPQWRKVSIKAGNIADTFEHVQNVVVTIEEAVIQTQMI